MKIIRFHLKISLTVLRSPSFRLALVKRNIEETLIQNQLYSIPSHFLSLNGTVIIVSFVLALSLSRDRNEINK